MKLLSSLTLGALLVAGSALAATSPSTTTATPAPAAQPAEKHHASMHCEKEARAKKLAGEEAKAFVKDCREGKKPS